MKITIVAGTNRTGSRTLKLARHVAALYEAQGVDVALVDLADLPLQQMDGGIYAERPAAMASMVQDVLSADGLVVVTPEYNGGFPGVLKLFIDLLPFPESFELRPVCFVGVAAGRFGALRPIEQLVQIWGYRNGIVFPERVMVHGATQNLSEEGVPTEAFVAGLLHTQVRHYVEFCRRLQGFPTA